MARLSAGFLLYRRRTGRLEVFLVHPGGPFWAKKDEGAWSIPKGECAEGEEPMAAARREVAEETGVVVAGDLLLLGEVRQASGKRVVAWATEMDFDPGAVRSNTFSMEWPPKSGKLREFPEVDRGDWFPIAAAKTKLLAAQVAFVDRLVAELGQPSDRVEAESDR
jgi:predicted NUDIX family NTP pyrophosphohydrolase